jgi:tetratricopeptide (TPR) repeat protein
MERMNGSEYVIGVLHMNLGATFVRAGKIDVARSHLKRSEQYYAKVNTRDFLAEIYRYFAAASLHEGALVEAEAYGQQSVKVARELTMRGEEGNTLRVLGDIAIARGDLEHAEILLKESLSILQEVQYEYEASCTELSLARLYRAGSQPQQCLARLEQCMDVFERLDAGLDLAAARSLRDTLLQIV